MISSVARRLPLTSRLSATSRLKMSAAISYINTDKAPAAIGPYSQCCIANGFAFVSGQIPVDPATNTLCTGDVRAQTELVLSNLAAVLTAAGTGLVNVVKTTVFIKDMNDFPIINEVYAARFGATRPARATVEVARLPKDVKVEIECVAVVP